MRLSTIKRLRAAVLPLLVAMAVAPRAGSARTWDPYDHKLVYNEAEWNSFNKNARFNYICSYIDDINALAGLAGAESVTKAQVHVMAESDPMYQSVARAYTTKDNNIYLNMEKLGLEDVGAGYAVMVLAHEIKHVEQNLHGRVNWGTAAVMDYDKANFSEETYGAQPHEIEAEQFGLSFPQYLKTHWDAMRAQGVVFED